MPRSRERPADFRARFIELGWSGIVGHYGTNSRVIERWMQEDGRDGLIAARADFVARRRFAHRLNRLIRERAPASIRVQVENRL